MTGEPHHFFDHEDPTEDPLREWLLANNVHYDQIILWADIDIDYDAKTLTVESLGSGYGTRRDGTPKTAVFFRNRVVTRRIVHPLLVEPPDGLMEMYEDACREAKNAEALKTLGQAGAVIIAVENGDRLLFVTSERMADQEATEKMRQALIDCLPSSVDVALVVGVDTVIRSRP